jgi:isocitrate dehydrogenase kinase/phosphatase
MKNKKKATKKATIITGEIEASVLDNVTDSGEAIEVAKKIDSARRAFPLEIFSENKEGEDLRNIIKYNLGPWLQQYFGDFKFNVTVKYKELNPSRRDSK